MAVAAATLGRRSKELRLGGWGGGLWGCVGLVLPHTLRPGVRSMAKHPPSSGEGCSCLALAVGLG